MSVDICTYHAQQLITTLPEMLVINVAQPDKEHRAIWRGDDGFDDTGTQPWLSQWLHVGNTTSVSGSGVVSYDVSVTDVSTAPGQHVPPTSSRTGVYCM